jgi:uncharacterized protein (DUF1919 family)
VGGVRQPKLMHACATIRCAQLTPFVNVYLSSQEMAKVENEACAHYFFEDLAVQNDAQSSALETVYTLSELPKPHCCEEVPSIASSLHC